MGPSAKVCALLLLLLWCGGVHFIMRKIRILSLETHLRWRNKGDPHFSMEGKYEGITQKLREREVLVNGTKLCF